jgi:hypothetical protein
LRDESENVLPNINFTGDETNTLKQSESAENITNYDIITFSIESSVKKRQGDITENPGNESRNGNFDLHQGGQFREEMNNTSPINFSSMFEGDHEDDTEKNLLSPTNVPARLSTKFSPLNDDVRSKLKQRVGDTLMLHFDEILSHGSFEQVSSNQNFEFICLILLVVVGIEDDRKSKSK